VALFLLPEGVTHVSLTSASSYDDAIDQYLDNLSWEGDVTKALAALEAIRFLQLRRPLASSAADGRSMDYESLEAQRKSLESYLAAHDTTNQPSTSFVRARPIL